MRHRVREKKLSVRTDTRRALVKNLACSIILHEKIKTTKTKGKVAKNLVEKLITTGKKNDLNAMRALRRLVPENVAKKVIEVLSPAFKDRPGGYLKLVRVENRKGDNSEMVYVFFPQEDLKKFAKTEPEKKETVKDEPKESVKAEKAKKKPTPKVKKAVATKK